jgi:uncharacterized Fe-S center protein
MDSDKTQNDLILTLNTSKYNYSKYNNSIDKTYVGSKIAQYESCIVLSHFNGYKYGGFSGAMKQLGIGFASQAGKAYVYSLGETSEYTQIKGLDSLNSSIFTTAMAIAASAVADYFKTRGGIAYINVLANISLGNVSLGDKALEPNIKEIGILASLDPVAIDKACYDLIVKEDTEGSKDWIKQSETLLGLNTLKVAEDKGMGTQDYNLINLNSNNLLLYILLGVGGAIIITVVIVVVVVIKKRKKAAKNDISEQEGEGLVRDTQA